MDKVSQSIVFTKQDLLPDSKAAILITHGLGEHCRRYDIWAGQLNSEGISTFRYDLPGHGRTRSGDWLFRDFDELTSALHEQYKNAIQLCEDRKIPLFLFGHSMGGLITADYVIRYDPQVIGVILSAPALDAGDMVRPWMIRGAKWLRKILPGLPVLKLPPEQLARDPEVVKRYNEDPWVYHDKIRVSTGYALLSKMEEVNERVKEFNLPVLMMQGQADQIVRPEVSKSFYDELVVADKTWHSYSGMYHEVLNDTGNEKVKEDIIKWIEQRTS